MVHQNFCDLCKDLGIPEPLRTTEEAARTFCVTQFSGFHTLPGTQGEIVYLLLTQQAFDDLHRAGFSTEQDARNFLIASVNQLPEDLQSKIAFMFFEEGLDRVLEQQRKAAHEEPQQHTQQPPSRKKEDEAPRAHDREQERRLHHAFELHRQLKAFADPYEAVQFYLDNLDAFPPNYLEGEFGHNPTLLAFFQQEVAARQAAQQPPKRSWWRRS